MNRIVRFLHWLYQWLREFVSPTVSAASMGFTITSGPAGTATALNITGVTVNGVQAPDGTTVVVNYVDSGGNPGPQSPLQGTTTGGNASLAYTADTAPGTYTFGPAVIDGETVPALGTAPFTRSACFAFGNPLTLSVSPSSAVLPLPLP